jgi:protein SCO1
MDKGIRNTVLSSIAIVVAVLGLTVYFTVREPALDDQQLRELGVFVLPASREIGTFALADQHGRPFTNADLAGRWSFVFFGFTHCPDLCPVAMSMLARVERHLAEGGRDRLHEQFSGVMVSVDPERDDAETLGRYVGAFSPRFTGIVGSRDDVAAFAHELNAAFAAVPHAANGRDYTIDHTVNIVIIDPRGRYRGFISPPYDADAVERAFIALAKRR